MEHVIVSVFEYTSKSWQEKPTYSMILCCPKKLIMPSSVKLYRIRHMCELLLVYNVRQHSVHLETQYQVCMCDKIYADDNLYCASSLKLIKKIKVIW